MFNVYDSVYIKVPMKHVMIMLNVHVYEGKQRVHNSIEMIELYLCDFFYIWQRLWLVLSCVISFASFLTCGKHFHDRIISLKLVYPSHFFFIKVPVLSQKGEMLCICVLRVSIYLFLWFFYGIAQSFYLYWLFSIYVFMKSVQCMR